MKYIANTLIVITSGIVLFNIGLVLSMMYWHTFTNSMPPFMGGRPVTDVAANLLASSLISGCGTALAALWKVSTND